MNPAPVLADWCLKSFVNPWNNVFRRTVLKVEIGMFADAVQNSLNILQILIIIRWFNHWSFPYCSAAISGDTISHAHYFVSDTVWQALSSHHHGHQPHVTLQAVRCAGQMHPSLAQMHPKEHFERYKSWLCCLQMINKKALFLKFKCLA